MVSVHQVLSLVISSNNIIITIIIITIILIVISLQHGIAKQVG